MQRAARRGQRGARLTRPTSRPASSRSTRSAIAAAAASWVTITTARPSSAPRAQQRAAPRRPPRRRGCRSARRRAATRRVVDERARDREALLLAAGELVRERAGDLAQPEPVDQLARRAPRRRGCAPRTRAASSTFASPLSSGSRWKNWKTKPIAAPAQRASARARTRRSPARPPTLDRARLGAVEPAEQVQQRRLARARAARGWRRPRRRATSRSAPSSTRRAARPSPNVLTSPRALTAAIP